MLPQINDIVEVTMPNFPNAVCADVDPEVFFPDERSRDSESGIRLAQEFCFSCVHRMECLEWAIKEDIEYGIWGGLTTNERKLGQRKNFKPRSDLGAKSYELRNEGVKIREIAAMLASTPTAISKAIARHVQTIGFAS